MKDQDKQNHDAIRNSEEYSRLERAEKILRNECIECGGEYGKHSDHCKTSLSQAVKELLEQLERLN